jgi:hypothetical protein
MILSILAESALRSLLLGGVVWIGLNLLRVRNPHLHDVLESAARTPAFAPEFAACGEDPCPLRRRNATDAGTGATLHRRVELAAGNR